MSRRKPGLAWVSRGGDSVLLQFTDGQRFDMPADLWDALVSANLTERYGWTFDPIDGTPYPPT